ncbi:sugar phosphate isomerase/epimerase [Variovorax sp. E3]|jgi:D-psicose/D-tagatose/L-ribulose 3-epimerase|uniref:sugar phosphate isomerase/epimerase family protein n=1 Tax=Variovorax sp. E3 TaxID=1914993 RepID=UPI0018DAFDA6|nr:sugar phosphate isomerase/epimerase family protein [Variovorax sp. E3]
MNKLGIHMFVYTPQWDEASARRVFERAADIGYDFVEVLIFDPDTVDARMTARLAEQHGLGVMATMCGKLSADLSNPDPVIAGRGEALVAKAIAVARDMGSPLLGGPSFSAVHRYAVQPSEMARERAVEAYRRLAGQAKSAGMRLGLEALNRYESNFINTLGQAAALIRQVGSDAMFVHADLFHMCIEEERLAQAVLDVRDLLGYVHVADSHRGRLGEGNLDFPAFFGALAQAGYDGPILFESFSPSVLGPDLAGLIALWREPWHDSDDTARKALAFMRAQIAAAHAALR